MPTRRYPPEILRDEELLDPPAEPARRYTTLSETLRRAAGGDESAIQTVFHYLSSANRDLHQMILAALHDLPDQSVWEGLLSCLVVLAAPESWTETGQAPLADWLHRIIRGGQVAGYDLERIEQGLVQAFILDESEAERRLKDGILRSTLDENEAAGKAERLRFAAAYLLGLRGDLGAIPILDTMVVSAPKKFALWAVQALSSLNDERCGPALIKALSRDRLELHREAQRALSALGRKAEPALAAALEHPDSHIRWHAARALGQIGDDRAVDALATGLYDDNLEVRWTSARVLASLEAAAIPAILAVLCCRPLTAPLRESTLHALHHMPSRQTQEYLMPLLRALSGPAAAVETPQVANRMLAEWGAPQ